jgi:hypothetical protein
MSIFLYLSLKDSHRGVCPWSKCSHVHDPKADNCGIYNGCGVYSGRAEIHIFYCWKVNGSFVQLFSTIGDN